MMTLRRYRRFCARTFAILMAVTLTPYLVQATVVNAAGEGFIPTSADDPSDLLTLALFVPTCLICFELSRLFVNRRRDLLMTYTRTLVYTSMLLGAVIYSRA